jgi:hypothetical protein
MTLSLQQLFAVPIDGFIFYLGEEGSDGLTESVQRAKLLPLYSCLLSGRCQTNLTGWDLWRLFFAFRSLRTGEVKTISFDQQGIVKRKELADGSFIFSPDFFRIDQLSQELFTDSQIVNEGLTVIVINATNEQGLAGEVGRLIKNSGANLIATEDGDQNYSQSVFYVKSDSVEKSYTLNKLTKVYNISKIEKKADLEADLELVIGKDFNLINQ